MKYFFTAILAFSFSLACPNLDGTYLCLKNSYRKDTHYTFKLSRTENAQWLYSIQAQPIGQAVASFYEFIADDVTREVVDKITGQKLMLQGECLGTELKVLGSTILPDQTKIEFSELLSLTPNRNLSNISLDIQGNTVAEICEWIGNLN